MNKPLPPRPTPPGKPEQVAHEDRISPGTDPIVAKASASASSCTTTSGNPSAPGASLPICPNCGYYLCRCRTVEKAGSNPAPVVPQEDAGGTGIGGLTVPQGQVSGGEVRYPRCSSKEPRQTDTTAGAGGITAVAPWPTFGPKLEGTTICCFCYWPPDQCICK